MIRTVFEAFRPKVGIGSGFRLRNFVRFRLKVGSESGVEGFNRFPLILNGGSPPPPPNRNSKCVFIIRGRFLSKCHVWGPKGLGSRLGREREREL